MRDAVFNACVADTVTFNIPQSDTNFSGGVYTIRLATQLVIADSLTINGPGIGAVTISGNNSVRVFNVTAASPATVTIANLTIANGRVADDTRAMISG